jgi:hypothetical protein
MKLNTAIFAAALSLPLLLNAQNTGSLSVKAHPGRAGVFLDGKYLGPAQNFGVARTYPVPAGDHELKLVDPRFEDLTKKITVPAGKKLKISESLKALPEPKGPFGSIRTIHPDKFAAVYVYDKYMGHVDEFSNSSQVLQLPAGEYKVRIVPASGPPVEQTIKLEANQTVIVK